MIFFVFPSFGIFSLTQTSVFMNLLGIAPSSSDCEGGVPSFQLAELHKHKGANPTALLPIVSQFMFFLAPVEICPISAFF